AGHRGRPDYELARELAERLAGAGIISGGLDTAAAARRACLRACGGAARAPSRGWGPQGWMGARGPLCYPWVFEELTGARAEPPAAEEVAAELLWVIDRAGEHLGPERARRS